jgi:hypothetical protein
VATARGSSRPPPRANRMGKAMTSATGACRLPVPAVRSARSARRRRWTTSDARSVAIAAERAPGWPTRQQGGRR